MRKLNVYRLQWRVTDTALFDAPDLEERIGRVDTVILGDVPGEKRTGARHGPE